MLPKTDGWAAGTGVEVAESAETGGVVIWGEIPSFLPFPQLLLFLAAFKLRTWPRMWSCPAWMLLPKRVWVY